MPLGYKILQELRTGKTPNYGKLWIFEYEAYALVPEGRMLEDRHRVTEVYLPRLWT